MAYAIGVTALSSCERTFTCTCVYPNSTIGTTRTTMKAVHKSDAEDRCSIMDKGAQAYDGACAL